MTHFIKYLVFGLINCISFSFIKYEILGYEIIPGSDPIMMALLFSPMMYYFTTKKKKVIKTMNCSYCSKEISENSKICNHCNGIM